MNVNRFYLDMLLSDFDHALRSLLGADGERLDAAVKRSNEGRQPPESAPVWAVQAILDCIAGSEDDADLARCEGCKKVLPKGEMTLCASEEDVVYTCKACDEGAPAEGLPTRTPVPDVTVADRANPKAIAERMAAGLFAPPAPWVRDGKLHGVTRGALVSLLEECVAIGIDCGRAAAGSR